MEQATCRATPATISILVGGPPSTQTTQLELTMIDLVEGMAVQAPDSSMVTWVAPDSSMVMWVATKLQKTSHTIKDIRKVLVCC